MTPRPTLKLAQRLLRPNIRPLRTFIQLQQQSRFYASPSQNWTPKAPPKVTSTSCRFLAGAGIFSLALGFYHLQPSVASLDAPPEAPSPDKDLPQFRLSEVRKHNRSSPTPWVIHGNKVYDITDWVSAHPGGDVILRAAGGSIDRYWDIFTIHKNQYVYDILTQYLIGHVHADDLTPDGIINDVIEDPFADDPERHKDLITKTLKPRNAETPVEALEASFLTPNDLFYVRNHMWVPTVDKPDQHILTVELPDGSTKTYTLDDLKTRFPHRTVIAVLQCSGNRRSNMSDGSKRKANGLPWDTGAISNAKWEGVLLADVLSDAGFDPSAPAEEGEEVRHVHFSGMEAYAASIPIRKAIDPKGDVLLAWGMNGQTLPRDHGFPLRSIVPGTVAARSVKWLNKVTLSDEESTSQWQRKDYKCFGPNQTKVDWDAAPAIQEMPVQSAISTVRISSNGSTDRPVSLSGYAYSGGGREIVRVDVSLDNGLTWSQASLLPDPTPSTHGAWAWKRWRFDGKVPFKKDEKCTTLVVKATDDSYNTQPESHAATWNIRGNLATAWHRVEVCSDCKDGLVRKTEKST